MTHPALSGKIPYHRTFNHDPDPDQRARISGMTGT
jgi:hypothetical protein